MENGVSSDSCKMYLRLRITVLARNSGNTSCRVSLSIQESCSGEKRLCSGDSGMNCRITRSERPCLIVPVMRIKEKDERW